MTQDTLSQLLEAANQLTPEEQRILITELTIRQQEKHWLPTTLQAGTSEEANLCFEGWQ